MSIDHFRHVKADDCKHCVYDDSEMGCLVNARGTIKFINGHMKCAKYILPIQQQQRKQRRSEDE